MEERKAVAPAQVEGLRRIFEKHRVRAGARILDLGCGTGRIAIHLAKEGYDVVGVDISPLFLRLAERWAAKEQVSARATFYRTDARKLRSFWTRQERSLTLSSISELRWDIYGKIEDQR